MQYVPIIAASATVTTVWRGAVAMAHVSGLRALEPLRERYASDEITQVKCQPMPQTNRS